MSGIANLRKQATALKRHGRGYDDMLVHMNKKELAGLESLARQHGGSLTRNPKTGLPEAGFLSSILPMLVGAGATFLSGGAAAPWWAGMAAGAATGAVTGDKNNSLLMNAGLGALGGWGGGSLYNSFMNAGLTGVEAEAAAAKMTAERAATAEALASSPLEGYAAQQELAPRIAEAANTLTPDQINEAAMRGFTDGTTVTNPNFLKQPPVPMGNAGVNPGGLDSSLGDKITPQQLGSKNIGGWDQFISGVKNVGSQFADKPLDTLSKYKMPLMAAGTSMLYGGAADTSSPLAALTSQGSPQRWGYNPGQPNPKFGQPGEPYFTPNQQFTRYAAQGGIMGLSGGGAPTQPRMIRGPGDGLSDSVPAHIDGKQPAALADGEFVVSSDVVSALGNGSTDAGARKLYDMMARIRQQAHGTKKQVRKVNERKVLPA